MLDPTLFRDNMPAVRAALKNRGVDLDNELDALAALDAERRRMIPQIEELKREQNAAGEEAGRAKREGRDITAIQEVNRQRAQRIKEASAELDVIEERRQRHLLTIPNVPDASVPVGTSAAGNAEVRRRREPRTFAFAPQAHWDLGPALGIIDFERGTRIAAARFAALVGPGARLERALINFMLDLHTKEHGYTEVLPPVMVNAGALFGTGQLPKFEEDLFKVEPGGYYLIPTAEVPVTNIHAEEILEADRLPIAYCAYTPCFRSEAGSYGKDVRGLIRQHQFDKIELVRFARPEDSYEQLEALTTHAEEVLKRLELPYRVAALCAGDLRQQRCEVLRPRGVAPLSGRLP